MENETFLHSEEFITEKNENGELISKKIKVDFDEHPNAINLDKTSDKTGKVVELPIIDDDDEVLRVLPDGTKVYRNEDPGAMYKSSPNVLNRVDYLSKVPEKERYFLKKGTLVEQNDSKKFRRGFTCDDDVIVTRVLDEETRKPIIIDHKTQYMALTTVNYFYNSVGEKVYLSFKPGEKFLSPRDGENKEKREEKLRKIK